MEVYTDHHSKGATAMAYGIKSIGQIACFVGFSWCMNRLAEMLRLHIPGSIIGIVILFVLLQTRIVKLEWVDAGAKWLLAEMLLFFIPPAVGIVQYKDLVWNSGVSILIVVAGSLLVVMTCTGLLAERLAKQKETKAR
jgi:holin-like protein